MNKPFENETQYRLLKLLADEPKLRQLDMAKKIGISVGKANGCMAELVKKGFIKVKRFQKARRKPAYVYHLTARGIEEKGRITVAFLESKLQEYEEVKRQIHTLTLEVEENGFDAMADPELKKGAVMHM